MIVPAFRYIFLHLTGFKNLSSVERISLQSGLKFMLATSIEIFIVNSHLDLLLANIVFLLINIVFLLVYIDFLLVYMVFFLANIDLLKVI
jgi:hypothetical protein